MYRASEKDGREILFFCGSYNLQSVFHVKP